MHQFIVHVMSPPSLCGTTCVTYFFVILQTCAAIACCYIHVFDLGPLEASVVKFLHEKGHDLQLTVGNATNHVGGVARMNETVHGYAESVGGGSVTFGD